MHLRLMTGIFRMSQISRKCSMIARFIQNLPNVPEHGRMVLSHQGNNFFTRGCRISKYFLLGGSPALCPNGIEIGHVFDAILYKRSSFPGIPFGMPYFRLFCFQLSKSMPFLMEKDNFPFFRSESCNEAY